MAAETQQKLHTATAYEALGVDPCAPVDLISASYWNLVKELQAFREYDQRIETMLHHAMRAYETLSDPKSRAEYDESIGQKKEPLTKRKFQRAKRTGLGFLPGRKKLQITADPYEVMGLHPSTLQTSVPDAYRAMRTQYLRLPPTSRRRNELLRLLDESYAVLSDPEKRALYDEAAAAKAATAATAAEEEAPKEIEPVLIYDDEDQEPVAIPEVAAPVEAEKLPVAEVAEEAVAAETVTAAQASGEARPDLMQTRYVPKDEPEEQAEVQAEAPEAPAPLVPDPAPSQAGRLKKTKPHREVTMDDLKPPEPVFSPARPRRAKVEGDVEALMLGRLAARMDELAAFGGSSGPPGEEEDESSK